MNNVASFLFGVIAGIWVCYFAVEGRLGINFNELKSSKNACLESLPRDQECIMVFDFVGVKKEKSE